MLEVIIIIRSSFTLGLTKVIFESSVISLRNLSFMYLIL